MKTNILVTGIVLATVGAVLLYPDDPRQRGEHADAARRHRTAIAAKRVEVVFVLDTTGSMSGLIHAAKEKIWSIASTLAQAQQAPEISMGLVAYRDRGDAYVTQVIDLNRDLDSMYAKLMDFAADGGGDGPEAVNEALEAAIASHVVEPGPEHVQGRVLGRRRAAAHGLPGRREVSASRRGRGRQGHRRQHDSVRQHRATPSRRGSTSPRSAAAATSRSSRPAAPSRSRRRSTRRSRRSRPSSTARASTTARRSSKLRWRRRSTATERLNEEASVAARARRGAFNVSAAGAATCWARASSSTTSRAAASTSPPFRPQSCRRRSRRCPSRSSAQLLAQTAQKREELQRQIAALAARARCVYKDAGRRRRRRRRRRSTSRSTTPCASRPHRSASITRTGRAFELNGARAGT